MSASYATPLRPSVLIKHLDGWIRRFAQIPSVCEADCVRVACMRAERRQRHAAHMDGRTMCCSALVVVAAQVADDLPAAKKRWCSQAVRHTYGARCTVIIQTGSRPGLAERMAKCAQASVATTYDHGSLLAGGRTTL